MHVPEPHPSATRFFALGDSAGALAAYANAERLSGNSAIGATSNRAYVLAVTGRESEARAELDDLLDRATERYVPSYGLAIVHAGLGELDAALDWLERGVTGRDILCITVETDERLEPLRDDPRFDSLVSRCMEGRRQASLGDTAL